MALPSDISAKRQELARMAVNYQSALTQLSTDFDRLQSAIDETKQLPAIDHSLHHLNDMSLEIKKRQREDHDEQYAVLQLLKETGRRTGEAAVIMENSEVAQEALQKLNEGDNFDRAARLKKIEKCVDECKTLMGDTEKYLEQVRNTEKPAPFTQSSVHNIPDEARINKVLSHMTYIAQNQRANMDRMERDIRLLEQRQRQSKKSDTKPQIIVERQLPIDPSQPSVPIHQIDVVRDRLRAAFQRHSDAAGKSHCKIADVSTASPLPRRSRKQQELSRIEQLLEESIRLHELDISRDDKLNKSGAMCVSVGTQSDPIPKEVIVAPKVEPKMLPPIKQEIISTPKTIPFVPTTLSLMPSDRELAASYLGESPERTADISRLTPQPPPKSTAAISPLATQTSPKETPKTPVTRSSSGESASSTASEVPKSPKEPTPIVESPTESPLRDLLKEDEPTKPIQESTLKANRDEKPKSSIFGGSPSLNNFSFNDKEAKPDEKSVAPAAAPTSSIFGAKPTDTNFSTPTTTTVSTEEKKKDPPPSLFSFKPAASQPQAGTSAAETAKPEPTPSTFSFKAAAESAVPATTTAIETKPVTFSFSQAAAATAQPTSIFGNKAPDASAQSSSIFGNKPAQPATTTNSSIPFSFASAATAAAQTADAPKPAATGSSIFGGFAAKNETKAAADDGMMDDQGSGMFGSGFMSGLGCKPNTSDQAKPSIFSFKPSTVPAATTGSSIFGGGLSKPAATGGSIFGGGQQQQQPAATQGSSIFGGPKPSGSIFGSKPATGGSIFGGGAQQQPQQQQGGGLFGAKAPEQSAQPSSIFGGAKPQQATGGSLFGGGATTGSTFGAKPQFGGSPVFGGQKPFGQQGSAFGGGSGGFAAAAKEMAQKGQPSLFGNTAAASGSSIFGGANASSPQQPASSIFGGGNTSAPQQPSKTSFTSWR